MARYNGKIDADVLAPKPMFAADADVIIILSRLSYADNDSLEKEYEKNPKLLKSLKELCKQVYNGEVDIYITPSVMAELGISPEVKVQYSEKMLGRNSGEIPGRIAKFVRTFCKPFAEPNSESFENEILTLAEEYCFHARFDHICKDGILKPCKDAFNLAQAVYFGLPFLTCNAAHYVKEFVDNRGNVVNRLEKIKEVNERLGYIFESEEEPYKHILPVDAKAYFPELMKKYPSQKFMENYYLVSKLKNISSEEVYEKNRDTFIKDIDKVEKLENGDYMPEVPQTMLVLVDEEKSLPDYVIPSYIEIVSVAKRKDNPYFVKNLDADILFYKSEDADENGNIRIEDYYKSLSVPRVAGRMDTESDEYQEFCRLLAAYEKIKNETKEILNDDGKQDE